MKCMEELIAYIKKYGSIGREEELLIRDLFRKIDIPKGQYFVESGKISSKIAFVESGVFRAVYYNRNGDDFTRYFIYEGRFIGDLSSFVSQTPSAGYIETITDASVWYIDYENFRVLEQQISIWPLLMTKLYAFVAESKLKLANIMINLDATERYTLFINHYPGLANRVPMAMIASYLGITPSSLSRIRKNK